MIIPLVKRFYIIVLTALVVLYNTTSICYGQKNLSVLAGEDYITIPFQYSQGFIIIDVTFHHIFPMKFILDTGAEHSILLNRACVDIMNVPYEKEVKILGADVSMGLKAWVIRNIPIQLFEGKKMIQDMIVLEEDVMNLGAITGIKVDGILGAEFLKHFVLEIDYKDSQIRLYNPETQRARWKKYEHIPMESYYNKPYIRTAIGLNLMQPMRQNLLLLDTGAALSLLLHLERDTLDCLPSNIVEGVIGKGLGGDLVGYTGLVGRLEVGSHQFDNFIASFQSFDSMYTRQDKIMRDGIIGNFLLDQFSLVFDFPARTLYFKKRHKKTMPMRIDRSGVVVHAFGEQFNKYYVHQVLKNSPGYEAGLKEGDIITKVGIWPANVLSLGKINKKLTSKRKKVRFTVLRNGKKVKGSILLRDLYQVKTGFQSL